MLQSNRIKIPIKQKKWDKAFYKIPGWKPEKIATAKVMVVGAGALGNEVLKNLALIGMGTIVLIDFDTIEYSNLSRSILYREKDTGRKKAEVAAERIQEINPSIQVQYLHGDIIYDVGLGLINEMDVIIGCLDNRLARLFINRHAYRMGKIWIDGGIENMDGQLDVYMPNHSCYECQLDSEARKIIDYRLGCDDIAQRNSNFGQISTTPISASIIAAMQVQEALKIIFDNQDKTLAGQRFKYYGMSNSSLQYRCAPLKEKCGSACQSAAATFISADLSYKNTVQETISILKKQLQSSKIIIHLDYNILLKIATLQTEQEHELVMPQFRFSQEVAIQYQEEAGEGIGFLKTTDKIDVNFPYQEMTLEELGIPRLQILTVETCNKLLFVELSNDRIIS